MFPTIHGGPRLGAQSGGVTADVAAKLVAVVSTGAHDPTLRFTDAFQPPLSCSTRWQRPDSPRCVWWASRGREELVCFS